MPSYQVRDVVAMAKQHVAELFQEESVFNIGLEEVVHDEAKNVWRVTIGFSRPWDEPKNPLTSFIDKPVFPRRTYKVVTISDDAGDITAVRNLDSRE